MNNTGKKSSGIRQNLPVIVLTLLALVLMANVILLISELRSDRYVYVREYSMLHRELKREDYPQLADDVRYDIARNVETQEDISELTHFVSFYDAALLYKAYLDCGETEKAAQQRAVMEAHGTYLVTEDVTAAEASILERLGLSDVSD